MSQQDNYIRGLINNYKRDGIPIELTTFISGTLKPLIEHWAGQYLITSYEYSGSTAKGTATIFGSDVDIFIPVRDFGAPLRNMYNSLFTSLLAYNPRRQNVSIGIEYCGYKIDVVPGRILSGYQNYFSLYKSKTDSWTQTNIRNHINNVVNSGRTEEIIALKIWKSRNNVDISSTLLELITIQALKFKTKGDLANNVWIVLQYIRDYITSVRIVDPSNTNNVLTEDLTRKDKIQIESIAIRSLSQQYWEYIIW